MRHAQRADRLAGPLVRGDDEHEGRVRVHLNREFVVSAGLGAVHGDDGFGGVAYLKYMEVAVV